MTATPTIRVFPQPPSTRLIAARQREADRYVNGVLLSLDDETLKSHGYSRAELSQARERPTASELLALEVQRHPALAPQRADVAEALADIGGEHGVALTLENA